MTLRDVTLESVRAMSDSDLRVMHRKAHQVYDGGRMLNVHDVFIRYTAKKHVILMEELHRRGITHEGDGFLETISYWVKSKLRKLSKKD